MNEEYYLITWDQFISRKLVNQKEIILTDNIDDAVKKMTIFNAEKRLSTTNYQKTNLTELFAKHGLKIETYFVLKEDEKEVEDETTEDED